MPEHPLRPLDSLHLVIAQEVGAAILATADKAMAASASALGMKVVLF